MDRALRFILVGAVAAAFFLVATGIPQAAGSGRDTDTKTAKFTFRSSRKVNEFPFRTLKGNWIRVTGGELKLAGKEGPIAVIPQKESIKIDVMGNGRQFKTCSSKGDIATVLTAEGNAYAIEFKRTGSTTTTVWWYRRACFMAGSIERTPVVLIDDNSNGSFNDIGVDAVVVGKSRYAVPLGKIILCGKKLCEIEVNAAGTEVSYARVDPATGPLDMRSKFRAAGRLEAAIVESDGSYFNMAALSSRAKIPAGEYKLLHGRVTAGPSLSCDIRAGKEMPPIQVSAAEKKNVYEWGGDPERKYGFRATIKASRSGAELNVQTQRNFHVFGCKSEEYTNFNPKLRPNIEIRNKKTGHVMPLGKPDTGWGGSLCDYTGRVDKNADISVRVISNELRKLLGRIESDWTDPE